jgi:site-specific recombinase XerD
MNDLVAIEKIAQWEKLKTLVLDSASSPITKRVYNMALNEFMAWFQRAPRPGFTKATVSAWRVSLEERRLGSSSIIIRMSAIRKLAAEAADNGLLAPELAQGISRVKSVKSTGVRVGNWLSQRQAQALLSAPDIRTVAGLRDRAILAVLLGCGLRRSEVAALTFAHVQQRDGRWCIVDLVGKHDRVRTAPMPAWVKVAIDAWTVASGVATGHAFRPVNCGGTVTGERLGEKVVWQMLKGYAAEVGVPGIAPHDLRRACARPSPAPTCRFTRCHRSPSSAPATAAPAPRCPSKQSRQDTAPVMPVAARNRTAARAARFFPPVRGGLFRIPSSREQTPSN